MMKILKLRIQYFIDSFIVRYVYKIHTQVEAHHTAWNYIKHHHGVIGYFPNSSMKRAIEILARTTISKTEYKRLCRVARVWYFYQQEINRLGDK